MDEFEGKWHVIFGTHFGAHLTHEKMKFLFFYIVIFSIYEDGTVRD